MLYIPAEDSYFLEEQVKNYISNLKDKKIHVLDMGSGTGIQAEACIKLGIQNKNILAVDIDAESLKMLKKKKLNARYSDLFSNIRKSKKFDLIIFNPPYLPKHEYDKGNDTTGGKEGYELIIKFLRQARLYLKKDAIILLLISSFTNPKIIERTARNLGYSIEKLAEKKLFFEKLEVWKLFGNLKTKNKRTI